MTYFFRIIGQEIFECELSTHLELCRSKILVIQALGLVLLRWHRR